MKTLSNLVIGVLLFHGIFRPVQLRAAADDSGDLAQGAAITVDSVYQNDPTYAANYAIDGDDSTRWASAVNAGTHWLQVDLGEVKSVNQVQINWESAYGRNYTVSASVDGTNWQTMVTITGNTNAGLMSHSFNTVSARYLLLNCTSAAFNSNISVYEFRVYCGNLAFNRSVTVDSTFSAGYEGYRAVDGDLGTRWASLPNAGTHWISVDLGQTKLVRQVQINWERASGADYTIQLSTNGTTWTTNVSVIGNGASGWLAHSFDAAPARYVKVNCTRANLGANISIYELYVGVEDSSTMVNFWTKIGVSASNFTGGNQPVPSNLASLLVPQFTNAGFNRIRGTLHLEDVIPTNLCASLADYTNNVNDIQNPANWDFSGLDWMNDATNYGFKILTVFAYTPTWLSCNSNWNGVPKNWAVWQDICNKVYARYKNQINWVEPWNETEYFLDLTGSIYTSPASFQADLYYYTAQGVRAAGGANVPVGGFALSINDFLTARATLQYLINRYGLSWVKANYNFYSCHQYWGDAAELDTASISQMLQAEGLDGSLPVFLDEWNYPYWWADTGEYTGQQAIGFAGKCLTKILKRGISADYYAFTQLYDPDSLALYPQMVSFKVAAVTLGLEQGGNVINQTLDSYIDSVAAVNPYGNSVVYLANYSDLTKRVSLNLSGIVNPTVTGTVYIGTIANDGTTPYETFSLNVSNNAATLTLDMTSNSVAGVILNGAVQTTNTVINPIVSNIAISSSQNVSSTYTGYDAYQAVDGLKKISDRGEWASDGELNPWIQLNWTTNMSVTEVVLWDRPNLTDAVNRGVLYFSDGSQIDVPFVANDGSPAAVAFPAKNVNWVKFQVTGGSGVNVGLSEFEVFGSLLPLVTSNAAESIIPNLNLDSGDGQMMISWDSSLTGWTLQTSSTLHGGTWTTVPGVFNNSATLQMLTTSSVFFRLKGN